MVVFTDEQLPAYMVSRQAIDTGLYAGQLEFHRRFLDYTEGVAGARSQPIRADSGLHLPWRETFD
jgi:hypothetical protein